MGLFSFFRSLFGSSKPSGKASSTPSRTPARPAVKAGQPASQPKPKTKAKAKGKDANKPKATKPAPKKVATPQAEKKPAGKPAAAETAKPAPPQPVQASGGFFNDDDDLDAALGAAFGETTRSTPSNEGVGDLAPSKHDEAAVQELFADIAANYSRPVKNFVLELRRGTATKEWIEICRPVMDSMIDAAESIDFASAAERMVDFSEALALAQNDDGAILSGEVRDLLLSCYDDLVEVLPDTFTIEASDEQRESVIIHSLLRQIPGVGHVTFEKLYSAGVTSLEALFVANKDELALVSGVPLKLCDRICAKVQEHREQLQRGGSNDGADQHKRLAELVLELRTQHEAFEQASDGDPNDPAIGSAKRESRRNRHSCVLQINVVLAELGEIDLVDEIKKLAFERRIERLEEFVSSTPVASAVPEAAVSADRPVIQG